MGYEDDLGPLARQQAMVPADWTRSLLVPERVAFGLGEKAWFDTKLDIAGTRLKIRGFSSDIVARVQPDGQVLLLLEDI